MGRNKVIDRERVLRSAELLVDHTGSDSLTNGNLAVKARISKGGVQSCFGTKDGMLDALLERWIADMDRRTSRGSEDRDMVESFILSRMYPDQDCVNRVASLMAALSRGYDSLHPLREWHRETGEILKSDGEDTSSLRLAYFASQGLFLLQALGMMAVPDEVAEGLRGDILALLDGSAAAGHGKV